MIDTSGIRVTLQLASYNLDTKTTVYTFILRYPRIILPEVLTHRVFSRNTASSRATPGKVLRKQVLKDPFVPLFVGKKQPGMQAYTELTGLRRKCVLGVYRLLRYPACIAHWTMEKLGTHKQVMNRVLEPWMWVEQIVTTTDLDNFFEQRTHKTAEPHFQVLANKMRETVTTADKLLTQMAAGKCMKFGEFSSTFTKLTGIRNLQVLPVGGWHCPFAEDFSTTIQDRLVQSAARCARVSYFLKDGRLSTMDEDMRLYNQLANSEPKHLSPLEHQAMALPNLPTSLHYPGNLRGFAQYRHFLTNEIHETVCSKTGVCSCKIQ